MNNINEKNEIRELEIQQAKELKNLKEKSNKNKNDLNNSLNNEEKELLERQKKELNELINNFDIKIKPKISSFYLQLKTKEYFLCKQERYIEAEETKQKAKKIYLEDNKYIDNEKKLKLLQKIEELNKKHRIEYMKFIKNKYKQIYYFQKDEENQKNSINDKYNKEKEKEKIKQTIQNIIHQNNEKKRIKEIKNNNENEFKKNKNNPWN